MWDKFHHLKLIGIKHLWDNLKYSNKFFGLTQKEYH